jgi:hypothetical protein
MSNVVLLSDYQNPWKEVFTLEREGSTLQVFVHTRTGEAEVVQMNSDGEAIRIPMNATDARLLAAVLVNKGTGVLPQ